MCHFRDLSHFYIYCHSATPVLQYEASPAEAVETSSKEQQQQQVPVCTSSLHQLRLRAKTPSQFPTELASLEHKLEGVEDRLELVRKGRGLFKLMRDKEMDKVYRHTLEREMCDDIVYT